MFRLHTLHKIYAILNIMAFLLLLCDGTFSRTHYKEYLVLLLNHNFIDPLPMYELGPMKGILAREELKVPEQNEGENDEQFKLRLMKVWKCQLLSIVL